MKISFRTTVFLAVVALCLFVIYTLFEADFDTSAFHISNVPCTSISDTEKSELSKQLQTLGNDMLKVQQDFEASSHEAYAVGYHFDEVNNILNLLGQDAISNPNVPRQVSKAREQEVCPEIFAGKDLGYGAPYYRLGFARLRCENFVPIDKLITLLLYTPNEPKKPAMNYREMMTTISSDYPEVQVILATEKELPKDTAATLKVKFRNEIIKKETKGSMWSKLLDQVKTPYVLIAPYVTHFDDDIDLYRLLRVLSYRDDVAVAGGSYRNLSGHWDLGCRQVSFNYWTAKYTSGYYRSFNECVVCDHLPGPFAAKTNWLKSLKFDTSLSDGVFLDLFWRSKNERLKANENLAVVCADVMFNIDPPPVPTHAWVDFANKHEIKKLVRSDGTAKWFGCRRGLGYTNKTGCVWADGTGVPPCDLWNLGEVVRFVMDACEEGGMVCEYAAGDIVGAVRFGSTHAWGKNAEVYFHSKDFTAFDKLRPKFEKVGFAFKSDQTGLGSFTISTRNWLVIMQGRESVEVGQMLTQGQLPTRVHVSGTWVRVPRNPGLFARGHFLAQYFSTGKKHGRDSYYSEELPTKCPNPEHSACLDQYPLGGNMQYLNNVP